jgi:hypothetical protein
MAEINQKPFVIAERKSSNRLQHSQATIMEIPGQGSVPDLTPRDEPQLAEAKDGQLRPMVTMGRRESLSPQLQRLNTIDDRSASSGPGSPMAKSGRKKEAGKFPVPQRGRVRDQITELNLLQNVSPLVRNFILESENSSYERFSRGQEVAFDDPILALDYIYILQGQLELKLELAATH